MNILQLFLIFFVWIYEVLVYFYRVLRSVFEEYLQGKYKVLLLFVHRTTIAFFFMEQTGDP
jgi:hypothetical protein